MEGFNEQVVKRTNNLKHTLIKVLAVLLLITIPLVCVLLAGIITSYLAVVGLFLLIGGIYVVWYVFSCQKVEYEYSIAGDELDISKIIALRKRKRICKVPVREIDILGKGEKTVDNMRFTKTFIAAKNIDDVEENYYAVYNNSAYGKCLLIFSPNEQILNGMKPYLHKDIVLKLFYNRNVGWFNEFYWYRYSKESNSI